MIIKNLILISFSIFYSFGICVSQVSSIEKTALLSLVKNKPEFDFLIVLLTKSDTHKDSFTTNGSNLDGDLRKR